MNWRQCIRCWPAMLKPWRETHSKESQDPCLRLTTIPPAPRPSSLPAAAQPSSPRSSLKLNPKHSHWRVGSRVGVVEGILLGLQSTAWSLFQLVFTEDPHLT